GRPPPAGRRPSRHRRLGPDICLTQPMDNCDICPMTRAWRAPDDRRGTVRWRCETRPGRGPAAASGGAVPRKEHVTLRRLTLGSRKYIPFLTVAGLLMATAAGFGVSNLTAGPFGHLGMSVARADICD